VRRWHREGLLSDGARFKWSWACEGEPADTISVRTKRDAVVLSYRVRGLLDAEWKPIEHRVPITWTTCHFGGQRPWFVCSVRANGQYCGRRVAVLYLGGAVFACRRCYRLAYDSQLLHGQIERNVAKLEKIRLRLGGSSDVLTPLPERPRGMHRRTYLRLRERSCAFR